MEHACQWLEQLLSTPSAVRAVVFGLLLSWSVTQVCKFGPIIQRLPYPADRTIVRLLAFLLAGITVVLLWPGPWPVRVLAAVITGLCAPAAYTGAVRIAYHYWPWLEPHLSASPQTKRGRRD